MPTPRPGNFLPDERAGSGPPEVIAVVAAIGQGRQPLGGCRVQRGEHMLTGGGQSRTGPDITAGGNGKTRDGSPPCSMR